MAELQVKNSVIHYEVSGEGSCFVFLPGLGKNVKQSFDYVPKSSGVKLVTMELRGNGSSDLGSLDDFTFDTMAKDVLTLMDELKIKKACVSGVSIGAGAAVNFAIRFPSRLTGLVLIRPAWVNHPVNDDVARLYRKLADIIEACPAISIAQAIFTQTEEYQKLRREAPAAAFSMLEHFSEPNILHSYPKYRKLSWLMPFQTLEQLHTIKVPTLTVVTKKDPIHPYQYGELYAAHIPNAQICEVIEKGDNEKLHNEQIKTAVSDFVEMNYL